MPPALLASLLAAAAGPVHVAGPRAICEDIEAGLRHERPDVEITATATAAARVFVVAPRGIGWMLSILEDGRPVEARDLGSDREPAIRLAVLLAVDTLDERPMPPLPSAPPRPPQARTTTTTATATVRVGPSPRSDWQLEAAVDGALSAGQRLSLTVAMHHSWGGWRGGVRGSVGLCCDIRGDGLEATRTSFSAVLEAGRVLFEQPLELSLGVAGGYSEEVLDVRVADQVYAGPSGAERAIQRDVVGRVFAAGAWAFVDGARVRVAAALGVELHPGVWSVRLPPPYGEGRNPIERPVVAPFVALGLTWSIW